MGVQLAQTDAGYCLQVYFDIVKEALWSFGVKLASYLPKCMQTLQTPTAA